VLLMLRVSVGLDDAQCNCEFQRDWCLGSRRCLGPGGTLRWLPDTVELALQSSSLIA